MWPQTARRARNCIAWTCKSRPMRFTLSAVRRMPFCKSIFLRKTRRLAIFRIASSQASPTREPTKIFLALGYLFSGIRRRGARRICMRPMVRGRPGTRWRKYRFAAGRWPITGFPSVPCFAFLRTARWKKRSCPGIPAATSAYIFSAGPMLLRPISTTCPKTPVWLPFP